MCEIIAVSNPGYVVYTIYAYTDYSKNGHDGIAVLECLNCNKFTDDACVINSSSQSITCGPSLGWPDPNFEQGRYHF